MKCDFRDRILISVRNDPFQGQPLHKKMRLILPLKAAHDVFNFTTSNETVCLEFNLQVVLASGMLKHMNSKLIFMGPSTQE